MIDEIKNEDRLYEILQKFRPHTIEFDAETDCSIMPPYHPQKLIVSKRLLKKSLKFFTPKEELVLDALSKEEIKAIESLPIKKLEVCSYMLNIYLLE